MPRYSVTLNSVIKFYAIVEVEADNENEAAEKAVDMAHKNEVDWETELFSKHHEDVEAVIVEEVDDE